MKDRDRDEPIHQSIHPPKRISHNYSILEKTYTVWREREQVWIEGWRFADNRILKHCTLTDSKRIVVVGN